MKIGFGKVEITAWEPELTMMGWGRMDNRIAGAKTPLFARAAAFDNGETTVVYASLDLMAISLAIRHAVLDRLSGDFPELDEHHLLLTATHTHSGPSGFSHYFFNNLSGPGFSATVFDSAVEGTVQAIRDAMDARREATIHVGRADMPMTEPVSFNRSWFAYNRNDDVEPVTEETRDEATDRTMHVVGAKNRHGEWIGCITWFPIHCTSVHAENDQLHGDNKGVAAARLEAELGDGAVALFAQSASGDVTPNYRWAPRRKKVIGHHDNDYESAEFAGAAQARLALEALRAAQPIDSATLSGATHYVDFASIEVSARFGRGETQKTDHGVIGLSMTEGTAEGPGPMRSLRSVNRWLTRRKARTNDDPKIPMLDVGLGVEGKFLGRFALKNLKIPALDPTIAYVRDKARSGELGPQPWIAEVLPLQVMQLGPVAILGLPFEPTTVAGRRLRAQLDSALQGRGVEQVIIGSYSNSYSGYCTTFEEYQVQHYEAGYTIFGPHQLGAVQTMIEWMVDRLDDMPLGTMPPEFDEDELLARKFEEPWPVKRAKPAW